MKYPYTFIFNDIKGDNIAFEAKKDCYMFIFGESFLKQHKEERIKYACRFTRNSTR